MYKLSHCCHRNMEGKSSHICELADTYSHHNKIIHKLKGLSFDFIKALTKHGSLQTLWGGLGLACVARAARLAKMALCGPHRPHRPRHTRPRHQPRHRRQRLGGRAAATQPSASEKEKMHPFFYVSSVIRSFQRGTPEDLELPFQFLRMYSSIADPTVRTCGWESDFHMFERIWRCHGMPDVQLSYIVSCDPPRTF